MGAKKVVRSSAGNYRYLLYAILASNGLSFVLYAIRAVDAGNFRYWFLLWNLLLAWLPLFFVWWLMRRLISTPWLSIGNIILTLLWLGFLPNSFYVVSDLIHLKSTGEVSLLYDAVLFFSCIFNGFISGFISLYLVHVQLIKRLRRIDAHAIIAAVLVLCSFAIYLGRYLRWNTWDVLVNPAGLLFDVSDRLINPVAHPQAFVTTLILSLLLGCMYTVTWQLVAAIRRE